MAEVKSGTIVQLGARHGRVVDVRGRPSSGAFSGDQLALVVWVDGERALVDVESLTVTEPHVDYPHEPGYLVDCPACEVRCHCGMATDGEPRDGLAPCVFHSEDNPHRDAS